MLNRHHKSKFQRFFDKRQNILTFFNAFRCRIDIKIARWVASSIFINVIYFHGNLLHRVDCLILEKETLSGKTMLVNLHGSISSGYVINLFKTLYSCNFVLEISHWLVKFNNLIV